MYFTIFEIHSYLFTDFQYKVNSSLFLLIIAIGFFNWLRLILTFATAALKASFIGLILETDNSSKLSSICIAVARRQ